MDVKAHMKRDVVSISAMVREATRAFIKRHIGLLPVVDDEDEPVGVAGLRAGAH
jgi:predicted transcriptional regulator